MSTVAEIRQAIEKLGAQERAELMSEFVQWEDDDWDRQMKADAVAGKFDEMNRQTLEEDRRGETRRLEDVL